MSRTIRIGCWAAFWGDTRAAAAQILRADVDYLVADYLSEITMALLARARAKNPASGYVGDAVDVLLPLLGAIHERGIKVVTNAGGLNSAACAAALQTAADAAGVPLRVAAVEGDDLMPRLDSLRALAPRDMFTGEAVPLDSMTMNAYLGARPIADALAAGAHIVVTGRCVDSAIALGPLMHEFKWSDEDYDLLSAGTLIGHVVECGPQCTGGNFTDWEDVPGWDDMGYPIAECRADGTAVITKPAGTGGMVTTATVGEQIVYEIGDPGAYVMPDVVCDWRNVQLLQVGDDRVEIQGARGAAPTTTYKVTATHADGYRVMSTAMFAGLDAAGRARKAGDAIVARADRLVREAGYEAFDESSVEVIGAGDTRGTEGRDDAAAEAVLKVGIRHRRREALDLVSLEFAPLALVAQGMTGMFAGRPRVAPVIRVFHFLISKELLAVSFRIGDEVHEVAVHRGDPDAVVGTESLSDRLDALPEDGVEVPLRVLAYARSGDKGNQANIGILARRPEFAAVVRDQVTAERVASHFAHYVTGDVRRWELPGLNAVNILLDGALGGTGGTSSLRYDPQAKSYAAMLLSLTVVAPREWGVVPPSTVPAAA